MLYQVETLGINLIAWHDLRLFFTFGQALSDTTFFEFL